MNFETLRKQYPEFHFHGMNIEESDLELCIEYHFEIKGLESFKPTYRFPKKEKTILSTTVILKKLLFSLGMVELISYWKCTCSPKVIIHQCSLDENQKQWWKKLYFHGLGEFFYLNKIQISQDQMMEIETVQKEIVGEELIQTYQGNLIPVGGGKDSFVTLELLKDMKKENHTFVINQVMSAIHATEAAGYKNQHIQVQRSLDPKLFELNKKGYLNGHTPFSSMVAFASVVVSVLWGKKYVCLSNESSANESTVKGESVNHQYSKSFEFEKDFNEYLNHFIFSEIQYFSLLRSLSELQIASIFSTLKEYHPVFKSCNVGSKQEIWCCDCAKCLFVYVLLSAFLSDEELIEIFNEDLLEKKSLQSILKELVGISENKPFECVGTREEVQVAITMAINKRKNENKNIPYLYQQCEKWGIVLNELDIEKYRQEYNRENLIPKEYEELIKKKVLECWK